MELEKAAVARRTDELEMRLARCGDNVASAHVQTDVGVESDFAERGGLDAAVKKAAEAEERCGKQQAVIAGLQEEIARLEDRQRREVARELDAAVEKAGEAEERCSEQQVVIMRLQEELARLEDSQKREVAKVRCCVARMAMERERRCWVFENKEASRSSSFAGKE